MRTSWLSSPRCWPRSVSRSKLRTSWLPPGHRRCLWVCRLRHRLAGWRPDDDVGGWRRRGGGLRWRLGLQPYWFLGHGWAESPDGLAEAGCSLGGRRLREVPGGGCASGQSGGVFACSLCVGRPVAGDAREEGRHFAADKVFRHAAGHDDAEGLKVVPALGPAGMASGQVRRLYLRSVAISAGQGLLRARKPPSETQRCMLAAGSRTGKTSW